MDGFFHARITANGKALSLTVDSENPGVSGVYIPGPTTDVRPGHPLTGQVDLAGPAHGSGVQVSLTSSNPDVLPPPSVTVPAGAGSATFPMTARVQSERVYDVVITAFANGMSQTTNVDARLVENDTTGQKTVQLSYSRDTDTVVSLTSDDPAVRHVLPPTMQVPAGRFTGYFTGTTSAPLTDDITVTVTASLNGQTANWPIVIKAHP